MYGLLIENVIEFIKFKYGEDIWLEIQDRSRIHEYAFVTHKMYSEKVIPRLAKAVQEVTGDAEDEFMREVGYDFVIFLGKYGYDKMLRVLGRSMRDFLNGLDNLHEYLRFSYPKMKPPSFFVTDETENGLTLNYRTQRRGYTHYVQGQLMRVGKLFYNIDVQVHVMADQKAVKEVGDTYDSTFRLVFDNREYRASLQKKAEIEKRQSVKDTVLPSKILFDLFPFHIRFDSSMIISGVGTSLRAVMPDICGKNLAEAFELKRPHLPFSWEVIKLYDNNIFDMQSTDLVIRNLDTYLGVKEGGGKKKKSKVDKSLSSVNYDDSELKEDIWASNAETEREYNSDKVCSIRTKETYTEILEDVFQPRRMRLKGQMMYIKDWSTYMFLATPALPNLDAMFETGLYINDLSMHDSSRDLVLAGTQQSAELKMALDQEVQKSKQLESSMQKLDKEMRRTDDLLYQMIPRQVAEKLRRGEPATSTCEVFRHVSILFSDVVGFTSICSRISPMAVVSMLNGMYTLFDNLSEHYNVYKVETIGDAYMVVGGAPTKSRLHAVRVVEMSLAMVENIVELKDPSTGNSISIRVGIHSGEVVAGVVGLKMPRYCLFGDTVNTASRMESTGSIMQVQISEITKGYLEDFPGYELEERGKVDVKGKGSMKTYWLKGRTPDAIDHLAIYEEEEKSDASDMSSQADSIEKRTSSLKGSLRGARRGSHGYTPVSPDENVSRAGSRAVSRAGSIALSRASTSPNFLLNDEKRSSLAGCPMDSLLSGDDAFSKPITSSREDVRTPTPPRPVDKKPEQQKSVLNFGQFNYDHSQMQGFMDPAHAHGTMDGAPIPHHRQIQSNSMDKHPRETPPSRPNNMQKSPDNNGSTPNQDQHVNSVQLSPVVETKDKVVIQVQPPPTRIISTADSGTNTNPVHVRSSACDIL